MYFLQVVLLNCFLGCCKVTNWKPPKIQYCSSRQFIPDYLRGKFLQVTL